MKIMGLLNSLLHPEASPRENSGYSGYVEISGVFTGDIANGMNVFVAPSGHIKGDIKARVVAIAGEVEGNVQAQNLLIHSSGKLLYDKLVYRELLVEDGGKMIRKSDATSKAPCVLNLPKAQEADRHPIKPDSNKNKNLQFHSSF